MIEYNYKKLPWYWLYFRRLQKIWCRLNLHVPTWAQSEESTHDEYFCQECCAILTKEQYEKFFSKARKIRKIIL